MVGRYFLYIRLREEQAAIYPMSIVIYTETVDPSRTVLLSTNYKIQRAGEQFNLVVLVNDLFNNFVEP